jgi:hypothetical protein
MGAKVGYNGKGEMEDEREKPDICVSGGNVGVSVCLYTVGAA